MKHDRSRGTLRTILRGYGLRYSKPREVILGYFGERDMHVSAEHLYLELKRRGENLSLSTVYLNLGVLKSAGLVREFSGVGGEALYDSNVGPHHHLICKGCGAILDLPEVAVSDVPLKALLKTHAENASGWQIDEPNLDLHGLCPACRKNPETAQFNASTIEEVEIEGTEVGGHT